MFQQLIWVAVGGALGSVSRYAVGQWIPLRTFPWATLTVNIIGSFLIGLLWSYFNDKWGANSSMKLLLMTGFCGGFTTFSALALENLELVHQGRYTTAILYIMLSLIAGLLAVALGWWIGQATR